MRSTTLASIGLISLCSAQRTTLFLPGFTGDPVLASAMGSDISATTYSLVCPPDRAVSFCNAESLTLTEGPGTAHVVLNESPYNGSPPSYTILDCSLTGITQAECTGTVVNGSSTLSVITTAVSGTELAAQYKPVTLTDSLPGSTSTAAAPGAGPTSETTSSGSVTSSTGTAPQSTTTAAQKSTTSGSSTAKTSDSVMNSPSGSSTPTATAASKTSSAGISQITGNLLAAGGMAMAMAVVCL